MKRLIWPLLACLGIALTVSAWADTFRATELLESAIQYRATEGRGAVLGTAPLSSVELIFDDSDLRRATLIREVDPTEFRSGNIFRDSDIPNRVFEVDLFPRIRFETIRIEAEVFDLPDGGSRMFTAVGTLTMHGVERVIGVPVEVMRKGAMVTASGSFEVLLSDYEMKRPRFLFVVVADAIEVEFRVVVGIGRE